MRVCHEEKKKKSKMRTRVYYEMYVPTKCRRDLFTFKENLRAFSGFNFSSTAHYLLLYILCFACLATKKKLVDIFHQQNEKLNHMHDFAITRFTLPLRWNQSPVCR